MALIRAKAAASQPKTTKTSTSAAAVNPSTQYVLPKRLARKVTVQEDTFGDADQALLKPRQYLGADAAKTLRDQSNMVAAIRQQVKVDGMMSSAVFNFSEVANTPWIIYAYDAITNEYNPEATQFLSSMLSLMDVVPPPDRGFNSAITIDTLVETLLDEILKGNAIAVELVLNKAYLPDRFALIPAESLQKIKKGDSTWYPQQQGQSGTIDLDIPTFFYEEFHKDAADSYVTPMMTAALTSTFHFMEFVDDMRRVLRKAGHSRLTVVLNAEKVQKSAPPEIRNNPEKMKDYMEQVRDEMVSVLRQVEPEDAIVTYDVATISNEEVRGEKADYKEILQALSGMAATAMKTNPSMLGMRLAGSQSLSNTESLIFLRTANGVRRPVRNLLRRMFTLMLRLYGYNVYVDVEFQPINLRPDDELETHRTIKQTRILQQLSLGLISDEEANQMLGLGPRPAGMPPLAGTMFMDVKAIDVSKATPNNGAQEKALTGTADNAPGGQ